MCLPACTIKLADTVSRRTALRALGVGLCAATADPGRADAADHCGWQSQDHRLHRRPQPGAGAGLIVEGSTMKPISLSGMARFAVAMASLGLAVAIVYRSAAESGSGPSPAKYQPSWESLDRHPLAPWWQEAKFGVYVHWSLASVPAWGNHSSFYWPNLLKSQRLEAEGPRAPKIDIAEEYVGLWQFH